MKDQEPNSHQDEIEEKLKKMGFGFVEEEEEEVELSKNEFLVQIDSSVNYLNSTILRSQIQLMQFEKMRGSIDEYERRGMRVRYKMIGNNLRIEPEEKGPAGFAAQHEAIRKLKDGEED